MGRSSGSARRTRGILGGRSEQVVRRVLDAAVVELARSGYTGFRMDEVASRAGVNKTTIYRRWPSRAALITALVDRMRTPLRASPLPDTGQLERDLVQAFTRRFTVGRKVEGRAWARLLDERYRPEVEAIIGSVVAERRDEWRSMVTRSIERGELPPRTDAQLLLELVRILVDSRPSPTLGRVATSSSPADAEASHTRSSRSASLRLDTVWLTLAVRTVIAAARAGALERSRRTRPVTKQPRRGPRVAS
ncbi:MAG: TetR/AcrR family transcriptional regulator [Deltaproteobacteria bacterium]|nr:TetR/AcrR family transcriptional regulator [Deltaproteobacteria bacterium]